VKSRSFLTLCPPELSGRDAEHLTEVTRQVTLVGKPHGIRNLRQCEIRVSHCADDTLVAVHRQQKMGAKSVADLVKMAEILGTRINSDFRRSPNMQSERRPANAASRTPFSVRTWPSQVTGKMIAPTRESPESHTRWF
jgi:hypothetical protein